jgi:hypothetical protein
MDQKAIVLYLRMKGMALDAIHDDLVRTIGKDVVAHSTVTKYTCSAQFSGRKETSPPEAPDVERSPVGDAILTALAEFPFPFSSGRKFSRRICLPRSVVHRHLTQSIRFTVRYLRWVPHFLTAEQRQRAIGSRWQSNYYRSSRCKPCTSGKTLSPWTSREFICSVSMI